MKHLDKNMMIGLLESTEIDSNVKNHFSECDKCLIEFLSLKSSYDEVVNAPFQNIPDHYIEAAKKNFNTGSEKERESSFLISKIFDIKKFKDILNPKIAIPTIGTIAAIFLITFLLDPSIDNLESNDSVANINKNIDEFYNDGGGGGAGSLENNQVELLQIAKSSVEEELDLLAAETRDTILIKEDDLYGSNQLMYQAASAPPADLAPKDDSDIWGDPEVAFRSLSSFIPTPNFKGLTISEILLKADSLNINVNIEENSSQFSQYPEQGKPFNYKRDTLKIKFPIK